MPAYNSYILLSHVSAGFRTQMETAINNLIGKLHLTWWQTTQLPTHLSLGQCMGTMKDSQNLIDRRNAEFAAKIKNLIETTKQSSAFLLPADIEITETGWIILKYQTLDFETHNGTGTQPTNIVQMHASFEKIVSYMQRKYPLIPDPWGNNFLPHISMGKVYGADILQAQQFLARNKDKIMDELIKLRPLNLYDLEFVYNSTPVDTVRLYQTTLARRNFNIDSVVNQTNYIDINFKNKDGMNRFINFIISISGEIHQQSANKNSYTVAVSLQNYNYLVGLIDGFHNIKISQTQTQQTTKFQLNPAALFFSHKHLLHCFSLEQ